LILIIGPHFLGLLKLSLLYRKARFDTAAEPAGRLRAYLVGLEWLQRRSAWMRAGVSPALFTALESLPGFMPPYETQTRAASVLRRGSRF